MEYDYYDDDDEDFERRWPKRVALLVVLLLVAVGAVVLFTRGSNDNKSTTAKTPTVAGTGSTLFSSGGGLFGSAAPTTTSIDDTVPELTEPTSETTDPPVTVEVAPPVPGTVATTTSVGATSTTTPLVTVAGNTDVASLPTVAPGTPFVTAPDGTPQPIVAIFDTSTITLTGAIPSAASAARLEALALAASQTPATIVDNMIINPSVPIGVGVRVIELNSPRFPEKSAKILADHAAQLDRVVRVMQALPNVSVLVVGHSDQKGGEASNFGLSVQRAQAVVNYLIYGGVSASRLSSRGVGDSDLLTTDTDDISLSLNRRTEFIFSGLLIP